MENDKYNRTNGTTLPELCRRYDGSRQRRRQIHRRPLHLQRSVYDPAIVSLGPYHHGRPELRDVDQVKHRFLDRLTSGDPAKKNSLYDRVLERIDEIRYCYADFECVGRYDDRALALMILLDASFIVSLVEVLAQDVDFSADWQFCIGGGNLLFVIRDIMLLENQIPLHHSRPKLHSHKRRRRTSSHPRSLPRLLLIEQNKTLPTTISGIKLAQHDDHNFNQTFRSVTHLKEKGIHFMPSSSLSVKGIKFESGAISGRLHIPIRVVSPISFVCMSNMIAYEMSPGSETGFEILSYTTFMKSLIEGPADMKELQEKGILINKYQNNEQLLEEIKALDTFGLDNLDIFKEVRQQIEKHCRSRTKTWMADLRHTQFRSPWTIAALLGAMFLLCLAFMQTYFTIHPRK
ncbi:hypothetical protein ABFS82_05G107700 [Erythranthe guttata]